MNTTKSADDLKWPGWWGEYQAALNERDSLLLGEKIYAAEAAISKRLQEIKNAPENSPEREAIRDALTELDRIRVRIFGHSDWQS